MTNEGVERSVTFWGGVFPIFLQYRAIQFLNKDTGLISDEVAGQRYEELHDIFSPVVEALCYRLRGFYLKDAQFISTLDGDFIPAQYMEWCKKTQDSAPTEFAPGQARAIVEANLGKPIDELFEHWDDEPCGVASIGQVHRARLHGGKEVVVKVQMPGIERRFRSDLVTLKQFCELAMPQHVPPLTEIEKQFMTEFDYVAEANNLQEIADNVMPHWSHKVIVPRPVKAMCTKEVLVMDYLPGIKLVDGLKKQYTALAAKLGYTLEELEQIQKAKLRSRASNDPTLKPNGRSLAHKTYRERMERLGLVMFVRMHDIYTNTWRFLYNLSLALTPYLPLSLPLPAHSLTSSSPSASDDDKDSPSALPYEWTPVPIDLPELVDTLLQVHGFEIFHDGAFNGDPHPGNILLMEDGRLGLIDYGQVKHLALADRLLYAKLVVALAHDDAEEIVRVATDEMGFESKYMRKDIMYRLISFWHDRDSPDILQGHNLQTFLDYCEAEDPVVEIPQEVVMAGRVNMMLRGMGNAFGMKLRIAPLWMPHAMELLDKYQVDYKYKGYVL